MRLSLPMFLNVFATSLLLNPTKVSHVEPVVDFFRKFPDQEQFAAMIREAGFRFVSYENLTLGVAAIHSGFKL